jgi:hypothetical protein
MMIIGCDYHPGFQQIAAVDSETGELQERRLEHREEAEKFYRDLSVGGASVRLGMEASGHARWFERLFSELGFEVWIRRRGRDPNEAGAQAEDGSPGCATDSATVVGRSLSAGLGTEPGESRSAATVVASAPDGAGAHADHEPTAGSGAERRTALQEEVVARSGTRATGFVQVSTLGEPALAQLTRRAIKRNLAIHGFGDRHRETVVIRGREGRI